MKIAVDATALGSGRGGDETLLRGLLLGLAEVVPDDGRTQFSLYLRPCARPPSKLVEHSAFSFRDMPWGPSPLRYGLTLPHLLRTERPRPDLVYSQTHSSPVSPVPPVLQLTDLSFYHVPWHYPPLTRLRLNLLVPLHARMAQAVMVISEFSRRDLLRTYSLSPERIFVVPCAVEQRPSPPALSASEELAWLGARGVTGPFFLYVGNLHPRKNVARLVEAFVRARQTSPALDKHQLVIVGGRWWRDSAEERAVLAAPAGCVVLTGRLPDTERDRFLRLAQALVYPALFEGFGLPPLEAMAVGTPVLASNTSALPEVLGDAALLVNPLSVGALADGLTRLATDHQLRSHLRERGRARATRYSVRETGERALEAFRAAAELAPPSLPAVRSAALAAAVTWLASIQSRSTPRSSAMRLRRHQRVRNASRMSSTQPSRDYVESAIAVPPIEYRPLHDVSPVSGEQL